MIVADQLRRNRKMTSTTSRSVSSSVNVTSSTDAWIVAERSYSVVTFTDGGISVWNCSSAAFTRFATSTVFVPGWRWIASTIDARAVVPARRLVVLHVVGDAADLVEVHRRAVAVRDDDVAELVRVLELAGRLHRERRLRAVEHARRHVHVLRRDRRWRRPRARCRAWRAGRDRAAGARRTSARRTRAPAPRRRPSTGAARSSSRRTRRACDSGTSSDVSASVRIGASAGFVFWYDGGMMPCGSCGASARSPPARPARRRRCSGRARTG